MSCFLFSHHILTVCAHELYVHVVVLCFHTYVCVFSRVRITYDYVVRFVLFVRWLWCHACRIDVHTSTPSSFMIVMCFDCNGLFCNVVFLIYQHPFACFMRCITPHANALHATHVFHLSLFAVCLRRCLCIIMSDCCYSCVFV